MQKTQNISVNQSMKDLSLFYVAGVEFQSEKTKTKSWTPVFNDVARYCGFPTRDLAATPPLTSFSMTARTNKQKK